MTLNPNPLVLFLNSCSFTLHASPNPKSKIRNLKSLRLIETQFHRAQVKVCSACGGHQADGHVSGWAGVVAWIGDGSHEVGTTLRTAEAAQAFPFSFRGVV